MGQRKVKNVFILSLYTGEKYTKKQFRTSEVQRQYSYCMFSPNFSGLWYVGVLGPSLYGEEAISIRGNATSLLREDFYQARKSDILSGWEAPSLIVYWIMYSGGRFRVIYGVSTTFIRNWPYNPRRFLRFFWDFWDFLRFFQDFFQIFEIFRGNFQDLRFFFQWTLGLSVDHGLDSRDPYLLSGVLDLRL